VKAVLGLDARVRGAAVSAREALLLERAAMLSGSYPARQRERLRALVRAARERAFVADAALEDGHAASAVVLYREAALLFMEARVVGESPEPSPEGAAEVGARFAMLPARRPSPGGPTALEALLAPASPVPAVVDEEVAERARATVRWLASLVEPRDRAELRAVGAVRGVAVALVAASLLAWWVSPLFAKRNVALHKPVRVSAVFPDASSSPAGLTDGVIAGAPYGVHTGIAEASWVEVDLLRVYSIDKIKIYNRGDGFGDDGLPMTLQVSEDGRAFKDVETRTTTFEQTAPWIAKGHGRAARYVRVRGARGKYVALSELEVYGR
jgi:hypothetical protein